MVSAQAARMPAAAASAVEDVARRIEDDIVFRVYHPRERLVEDELMRRYGAKRHVVRQALAGLERDGFVVLELDNGRFMNHSLKPNTDFTRPDVGYAIADIHPGEELTCNYFEFDRTFQGFDEAAYAVQMPSATNGVGAGISASL